MSLKTPIAFCIFNRPRQTRRVFDAIAKQKPARLLVVGDGPRDSHPNDPELVQKTRDVVNQVNWPCNVETNFSNANLGCRQRMATGLTWAFERCEELIVLEDDCLPHESFFAYCETLLERYRDDERIMMISGDNFQPEKRTDHSYYFSRYPHIWGWASWKRAWQHYDINMPDWKSKRSQGVLRNQFANVNEYEFWKNILEQQYLNQVDTWDYAWAYSLWKRNGLAILPETNLISNVGFDSDATHTTDSSSVIANLETADIGELDHPKWIDRHVEADQWTYENLFGKQQLCLEESLSWRKRLNNFIRRKKSA